MRDAKQDVARAGALLMVTMEAPATLEEEFNDWYDTEHFPQRLALPGFLCGSRWVCVEGWPRWLALYGMKDLAVLDTAAYRAVSGAQATPWSRRILPRTTGRSRFVAQALPGAGLPTVLNCARLCSFSLQFGEVQTDETIMSFFAQLRTRLAEDAHARWVGGFHAGTTLQVLAGIDAPLHEAALAALLKAPACARLASCNVYLPYQRSSY